MPRTSQQLTRTGRRISKGKCGHVTKYVGRSKALRKLQVTLNDFNRLCIMKGIFPRNPKGKATKGKIYYHIKDILFLQHEPLLQKFRDMKVYLRKHTRLVKRYEQSDAAALVKPVFKSDHLVKERYPTFIDALRDADDALSMLFLFASLHVKVAKDYDEKRASMVMRLIREWSNYVELTQSLRKVFVSIKGYYLQAEVKGVPVTWLVPHKAVQNTDVNVDFKVMSYFLEFYETLVRCINFRLFKEEKQDYPPVISADREAELVKEFFAASKTTEKKSTKAVKNDTLSASVKAAALKANKVASNDDDDEEEAEDKSTSLESFHALDPNGLPLINDDDAKVKKTFAGCVFLVSREVPYDIASFVIRCGGGKVFRETDLTVQEAQSNKFTHQIVDRPKLTTLLPSRKYVQPQWIFDSFNERVQLPIQPYGIGQKLPPHLSPFVNDEKQGYIPEQRNVLREWAGLNPLTLDIVEKATKTAEEIRAEEEEAEDAEYRAGLQKEKGGKKNAKATKAAPKEEEEVMILEEDDELMADDEDDDEDVEISEDDEDDEGMITSDDEEEEISKPKPAPKPSAFNAKDNHADLSRIMLSGKKQKILERRDYAIARVEKRADNLTKKRKASDEAEKNVKNKRSK